MLNARCHDEHDRRTGPRPPRRFRGHPDFAGLPRLIALMTGDEKHAPAAHSTLDALWVLYDRVLRVTPDAVDDPGRDRFLLSKGHGPMAYYAVLAAHGFFDESLLPGFGSYDSPLGHHPDRLLVPGPRSAAAPSATGCRSASGPCWGCAPRGSPTPGYGS